MPKYSRTKKYEELRNKLQSDNEANISSKELSEYANRLNKIDAETFESMKTNNDNINHDPIHRRRENTFNQDNNLNFAVKDDKYNNNFNNEYLDEYIDEVKQYMMDKGLMASENTQQNILRELKGERPKKSYEAPAANEAPTTIKDTMEVPSFANQSLPSEYNNISVDDLQKRDRISTEMKKVINSEPKYDFFDDSDSYDTISNLETSLAQEKTAREKLVSETTQMRAQLDEYEDNLTDVNDKMQHTNRILNFVLVVLIFALLIVLAVILYMVLLNKGTI